MEKEIWHVMKEIWPVIVGAFMIGLSWAAVKWQLKNIVSTVKHLQKRFGKMNRNFIKKHVKMAEDIKNAEDVINKFLIQDCAARRKSCLGDIDETYVRKENFNIVITNLNDKIDRIDLVSKGNTELLKEILDKVS